MDDENSNTFRRMSSRTRKVAPRMVAALASSDNRTQVCHNRVIENRFLGFWFLYLGTSL
jgi:zinc finger HIT domain-containing protein 1